MRISRILPLLLAALGGAAIALPAMAETSPTRQVPAAVRAAVVSQLDGAKPDDVSATPIPGLYEVTMGGLIAYVSADGKYLVSGSLYDLGSQKNLTLSRRNAARAKALTAVSAADTITFSPAKPTKTVTVFTDVDCGYCRKFHTHMAEVNKQGVRVRYMMFPRTGPGTESWRKAETVWCSEDRKAALTRAKQGKKLQPGKKCDAAAVRAQYEMGLDLGVEGTPAIFTESGEYIGGYLTPEQLVEILQETAKTAAAAR